jgi:hypothetical protein
MRTITKTVYTYDELSEEAKTKALEWFSADFPNFEWWDGVFEDAKNIGLKIIEFELDRGSYVRADFLASAEETAHKIEKDHGENCETYIDAKKYLADRATLIGSAEKDENGDLADEYGLDKSLDELDAEFLATLQEDYRILLQKEYDYLTSREEMEEVIRANGYEFLKNGKRA